MELTNVHVPLKMAFSGIVKMTVEWRGIIQIKRLHYV